MMVEKWRKYGKVRYLIQLRTEKTERTAGHPGGLYENSKTALLSPKNIRQNKKAYYI